MEVISKQDKSKSPAYKEFIKKLESDLQKRTLREGEIAIGTVEEVGKKVIIVDLGRVTFQNDFVCIGDYILEIEITCSPDAENC